MRGSAARLDQVLPWLPAALLLGVALPFAGCIDGGHSSRTVRSGCLGAADPSRPVGGSPSAVALLGTVDPRTGATRGDRTRLVRFSVPGGAVEATSRLPRQPAPRDLDRPGAARLESASGPLLAVTRDGGNVVALLRDRVSARDRVAVLDARSLRLRCSHPLDQGVRYTGVVLGRSRVYAYGVRRARPGRWDAVVTVADLRTGALAGTRTLRQSAKRGKDWYVYWGALSEDERRLLLSYHGGDTTGADWYRVSHDGSVSPRGSRRMDIGEAHGSIEAVRRGFLAATGGDRVLVLNRDGRVTRRLPVGATKSHLMEFVVDSDGRFVYVSGCGARPAIQRLDLTRAGRRSMSTGEVCGKPLAVHDNRYLVLDALHVGRLGFPGRPEGLRVLDLKEPDSGRRIALPRSTRAFDAVIVRARP